MTHGITLGKHNSTHQAIMKTLTHLMSLNTTHMHCTQSYPGAPSISILPTSGSKLLNMTLLGANWSPGDNEAPGSYRGCTVSFYVDPIRFAVNPAPAILGLRQRAHMQIHAIPASCRSAASTTTNLIRWSAIQTMGPCTHHVYAYIYTLYQHSHYIQMRSPDFRTPRRRTRMHLCTSF